MKKTKLLMIIFLSAGVFTSCKEESTSTESNTQEKVETNQTETHSNDDSISLNNGEKWEVNKEMLPHIEKSEEVFTNFEGDDYTALSEEMMTHTNNLIQSCTMDGPSHDELHKWLHPHIELIKKLGESQDKKEGSTIYQRLEKSFNTFHKYFE